MTSGHRILVDRPSGERLVRIVCFGTSRHYSREQAEGLAGFLYGTPAGLDPDEATAVAAAITRALRGLVAEDDAADAAKGARP